MLVRLRFLVVTLWLGFIAVSSVQAGATVVIVSSERSVAYLEAADALVGQLERAGLAQREVLRLTAAELSAAGRLKPRLFVALGVEAALALAQTEPAAPVLCALLPRISFERVLQTSGRKASPQFSAIYLDQPWSRQLELVRLALPGASRVGVLWGPTSQVQAPALRALAHASGLQLVEAAVERDDLLFAGLKTVLEDAHLLLAVADPQVYSSNSIQNILLSSFRAKVPLLAFSPAYVRAGALLALHVTPAQIGRQAATIASTVLQGKALSATPAYPQDFTVTVNEHVARSLGLVLDPDVLTAQLSRREAAP